MHQGPQRGGCVSAALHKKLRRRQNTKRIACNMDDRPNRRQPHRDSCLQRHSRMPTQGWNLVQADHSSHARRKIRDDNAHSVSDHFALSGPCPSSLTLRIPDCARTTQWQMHLAQHQSVAAHLSHLLDPAKNLASQSCSISSRLRRQTTMFSREFISSPWEALQALATRSLEWSWRTTATSRNPWR